jgi:hypothetical protein
MDQELGSGNFRRFDLNEIATSSPALHPRARTTVERLSP